MSEWETVKRPRLDSSLDQVPFTTNSQPQLPFSTFLSNSFRLNNSEKHPVLSDKKLTIYNLKGKELFRREKER